MEPPHGGQRSRRAQQLPCHINGLPPGRELADPGSRGDDREPKENVVSSRSVYDACEHGLTGDGVTNDQAALAALLDRLGDAYR